LRNAVKIQTLYPAFVFNHRVLIGNNACQRKIDGENIDTLASVQKSLFQYLWLEKEEEHCAAY